MRCATKWTNYLRNNKSKTSHCVQQLLPALPFALVVFTCKAAPLNDKFLNVDGHVGPIETTVYCILYYKHFKLFLNIR